MFQISDIVVRIRIRGSVPLQLQILLILPVTFKMPSFNAYSFLKVHLHNFLKIKRHKEVTKQWKWRFFCLCLVVDERIRIRILISTSDYGSGSERPKILPVIWIRNTGIYWFKKAYGHSNVGSFMAHNLVRTDRRAGEILKNWSVPYLVVKKSFWTFWCW